MDDFTPPGGWEQLHWHRDPNSKRYRSAATAARACQWLNANEHAGDCWLYRPGPVVDGRVVLERRWVGRFEAGISNPPAPRGEDPH